MEPQGRVESEGCIAPRDQQQLIQGNDRCRKLRSFIQHPASVDDPADALGRQEMARPLDHLTDPVDTRDADRPEPSFGLAELIRQSPVPALWEIDVLMDTDDQPVLGGAPGPHSARPRRWPHGGP